MNFLKINFYYGTKDKVLRSNVFLWNPKSEMYYYMETKYVNFDNVVYIDEESFEINCINQDSEAVTLVLHRIATLTKEVIVVTEDEYKRIIDYITSGTLVI